jgi:hypothetical protein
MTYVILYLYYFYLSDNWPTFESSQDNVLYQCRLCNEEVFYDHEDHQNGKAGTCEQLLLQHHLLEGKRVLK